MGGAGHRAGAALGHIARVGIAIVAMTACGGQSWSATTRPATPASTVPDRSGLPTTTVAQTATDSATFCDRARQLVAVISSVSSPTAANVAADARAVALLAAHAPHAVKQPFQTVADAFASYADAARRAGPDPHKQAGAILAVAFSLDGRRVTTAYTVVKQYMTNTCHVQLDPKDNAPAQRLETFDLDEAIRHDPKFSRLVVSKTIATFMGSTTVNIWGDTVDATNSLEICRDVEGPVYAKAPNAVIEVSRDTQHPLARSTKPGGCSTP